MFNLTFRFLRVGLSAFVLLGAAGTATAQTIPHALVASPDIYKVIAENGVYRVIEVTWKAGQRDQMHSHPASAVYYPMDCELRGYRPTGATSQGAPKAGTAVVQQPIAAHSVENIGQSDCKVIMFEPK